MLATSMKQNMNHNLKVMSEEINKRKQCLADVKVGLCISLGLTWICVFVWVLVLVWVVIILCIIAFFILLSFSDFEI